MKVGLMPATKRGKWSLGLAAVMPVLFSVGNLLANGFYKSIPSGGSIIADLFARPLLVLSMLGGFACGVVALITGLVALIKLRERSVLVIGSTVVGGLLVLFLVGEIIFPH